MDCSSAFERENVPRFESREIKIIGCQYTLYLIENPVIFVIVKNRITYLREIRNRSWEIVYQ